MKVISKISNILIFMNNFINMKHLKVLKLLALIYILFLDI